MPILQIWKIKKNVKVPSKEVHPLCVNKLTHFQFGVITKGFPGGSVVKNMPAKQETGVRSHGREDPLEKEMATGSSILAWRISWTEELGGLWSMLRRVNALELLNEHIFSLGS